MLIFCQDFSFVIVRALMTVGEQIKAQYRVWVWHVVTMARLIQQENVLMFFVPLAARPDE